MTLKEAIEHARKKANELGGCECAKDHLQLTEWLEELQALKSPETATIEGWVARDACDALYLHQSKPELSSGIGFWYDGYDKRSLPEDIFPEITFKNSPRKVRITITPIEDE